MSKHSLQEGNLHLTSSRTDREMESQGNCQIQIAKKTFCYGSLNSTIEDALCFQPSSKLTPENDRFMKEMLLILSKYSSLNVTPKAKNKPNNISKNVNTKVRKHDEPNGSHSSRFHQININGSKDRIALVKKPMPKHTNYPQKYKTKMPKQDLLGDNDNEMVNKMVMTEKNKIKYLDTVKALCDCDQSLFNSKFLDSKQSFLELLSQIDNIQEVIPQVVEILAKVSNSEWPFKNDVLLNSIDSEFIDKLIIYIALFPSDYNRENFSVSEIEDLSENIISFCESLNKLIPLKSKEETKKLLLSLQYCLKAFKEYENIEINEMYYKKITDIMTSYSEPTVVKKIKNKDEILENKNSIKPPNSVKTIEIFPTNHDLFNTKVFLRENIVNGSYIDVEHYIDVQFRLLREDFIAPLRSGIQQYCKTIAEGSYDKNARFDNIRIHENVKILHGVFTNGRFAHVVQLSTGIHNLPKRFIFGSLLLFTMDNFNTFLCTTVVNVVNDVLLTVELCDTPQNVEAIYDSNYTMLETEIYFEQYVHVLRALQQIDVNTFPMKEYIVDVKRKTKDPDVTTNQDIPVGLNISQENAFKYAMANEFVVIQGPPGTGKTFLALKIAEALLRSNNPTYFFQHLLWCRDDYDNEYDSEEDDWMARKNRIICVYKNKLVKKKFHDYFCEEERSHSPILLVCYTNHALDQFLEGLLKCTKKVIRVGGQSKNEVVKEFNLKTIRSVWMKRERYARRSCNCYSCREEIERLNCYFRHLEIIREVKFEYLIKLKLLENIAVNGILKMHVLSHCIHSKFKASLSGGSYENWLLQGAYTSDLTEDNFEVNDKPQVVLQTHQLVSEIRQCTAYKYIDDLTIDDVESIEDQADVCVDNKFVVKVSDLRKESANLQKKLSKLQKKGGDENILDTYHAQIDIIVRQHRYISYMLALKTPTDLKRIQELSEVSNVWSISHEDRWVLYRWWVHQYIHYIKYEMKFIEYSFTTEQETFARTQNDLELKIINSANIVGMTTTGAARLKNTLDKIMPEIVIVEEAAEVLEAHIIASLNPAVKKVILIGDHKQLKPSPAVYKLAKQYKLDISLFERMINNGLGFQVLNIQHRMRPEIASLIVPAIYPDLKNGKMVHNMPDIRGVASNVFFVTHNHPEDEITDSSSRCNAHEVDFLISLCEYLFKQGYSDSEITILATYAGQMTALERERRKRYLSSAVRITTVDNYQGEENEIILLSLVRSNAEARIGFLSAENRVCVALSRAKNGLYIIGNMDNLICSSTIWPQIKTQLENMNAIGPALPLGCKIHPDKRNSVANGSDFRRIPCSGCNVKCGTKLTCDHTCQEFCHSLDSDHKKEYSCPMPCERMACKVHRCPKQCGEECGSCSIMIEKVLLCGHSANLKCAKDPTIYDCQQLVEVKLEKCGHTTTTWCCLADLNPICDVPCLAKLSCGHVCENVCSHYNHRNKKCIVEVTKILKCGHETIVECCTPITKVNCLEPCSKSFQCGHACKKQCGIDCGDCDSLVQKLLVPCGHKMVLKCSATSESSQCSQPCVLKLSCGHNCTSTCSADCSTVICEQIVQYGFEPACEHDLIKVPCHINKPELRANSDRLLQYCVAPCRAELPCGHICAGQCGKCLQGRLHIPCTHMCIRTLPCGHSCDQRCSSECPPICYQPCFYCCQHQDCSSVCGEPCTPCKEPCGRSCKHQHCSRQCSDICDCSPCDKPCSKILYCGHPCAGYCGEICPKDCSICEPETFITPPGYVFNPDHRYVVIENCGHPLEDQLLKGLIVMMKLKGKVGKCPVCNQPIRQVKRYKDSIIAFYKKLVDIKNLKKNEMTGVLQEIRTMTDDLKFTSTTSLEKYGVDAISIFQELKKVRHEHKTPFWVCTLFQKLRSIGDRFQCEIDNGDDYDLVIERCKLLMKALALRVKSMSSSDHKEMLTEIHCLKTAVKHWPVNRDLLLSLKKYSLDELNAL